MKISRAAWKELDEVVWLWNPIGVPRNEFATDEYSCVIEQVVPLLQRGAGVEEIAGHFDLFLPEHFGLPPQSGALGFAESAIAWWKRVQGEESC